MHLDAGGQEVGTRAGTGNVPGTLGLAAVVAARADALEDAIDPMRDWRDRFAADVLDSVPEVAVDGGRAPRVPSTSSLRFAGIDAKRSSPTTPVSVAIDVLDAHHMQVTTAMSLPHLVTTRRHVLCSAARDVHGL